MINPSPIDMIPLRLEGYAGDALCPCRYLRKYVCTDGSVPASKVGEKLGRDAAGPSNGNAWG